VRERGAPFRANEQGTGNRRAGIWPRGVNVRAGARADFSPSPPPAICHRTGPRPQEQGRQRPLSFSDHIRTRERNKEIAFV